jgi:hypothetical protein
MAKGALLMGAIQNNFCTLCTLFRLTKQSPFKRWLTVTGGERIDETLNPELTIDRALETYSIKAYSRQLINHLPRAIKTIKELTIE